MADVSSVEDTRLSRVMIRKIYTLVEIANQ